MTERPEANILLVDDDEAKRYTIAKILGRANYLVREAQTGREALRMAAALPDLVVLDVRLPDMDGFEVCRRLKSDPATRAIPVLHVSGTFVDIEDKVQGLESGADGYLTSVAEPLELIATVRALLRARRAEDAAHLTSRQWQTTFDAISDGVMLLDGEGKVVQVNRTLERILGRPWGELVEKDLPALLGAPSPGEPTLFSRMLESGGRETREVSLGASWLRVNVDPIRDADHVVKGALCLVSDITGQKRLEMQLLHQAERLKEADRRKDEFLAMLAHELRNPLAPLSNSLEIIGLPGVGPSEIDQSLQIARRQIQYMGRLLEDLLDVSRITRGKVELRKQEVDMATIVTHAVETTRSFIASRQHALAVALPSEVVPVLGDPTRLEQIVANLLNNAAKYTDPGGRIEVTLAREGDQAAVRVRDTGIGISREMQEHIFELFVQAEQSLDRSQGGLGIGLTLAHSLVELHGGTISVASEGVGLGSEFVVRLPVLALRENVAPACGRSTPTDPGGRLRILLVDDSHDATKTLGKILEMRGHEISSVGDGPTAIERAAAWAPDVVMLDIGLPGMDGYQVGDRLRQRWGPDRLKMIALTGYGGEEARSRALQAGFDYHLVKPVNFDELYKILDELARRVDLGPPESGP
jgi:PAS domain S-box-containing protein